MGKINAENRVNLTATRITRHECKEGKDYSLLWDEQSRSLALQTTRTGHKSYVFQDRIHGKPLRIVIGSPDSWTIPQARAKANELKVMVDQGIDPRKIAKDAKTKATAEAAEKSARKVPARDAWDTYLAARKKLWSAVHYQDHLNLSQEGGKPAKIGNRLTTAGPLASLLCLPLYGITAKAVADWISKESKSRATATRNAYRKFKPFIAWCTKHPDYKHGVHADCCTEDNVVEIVPKGVAKAADALHKDHLPLWFEHVLKISNPYFSAFPQALLLTGARRQEMEHLKWTDLSFQWKTMRLYDTENGTGERIISLPPYLASVLNALPRINEWVFASPTSMEGHVVGVTKPHMQALKKANLPHVSLHGLRRSFKNFSEWLGTVPVGVVAQIMGHSPSATVEKHYTHRGADFLLIHHERIEAWILEQAGIKLGEKKTA